MPTTPRPPPNRWSRLMILATYVLAITILPGCSVSPTIAQMSLKASDRLNPNLQGQAMPIVVRIYQLRASDVFSSADFFALYNEDRKILANDLVSRKELKLRPGESRELQLESMEGSKYVGVFAAFSDLKSAQWRAIEPVLPNETTALTVQFQPDSVIVTPVDDSWW